jgi:tetratricopeptide (TPR) repeat protein
MLHLRGHLALALLIVVAFSYGCRPGEPPPTETSKEASSVPITTGSAQALEAYLAGRGLQERLRAVDARVEFEKAAAVDPSFALAQLGLATTAPTNRDFFAAAMQAQELAVTASEGERLMIEAFMAGVNAQPDRQLELLTSLEASFPNDQRVQQQLATFHFFTRQDYGTAATHLERAIAIDPEFSPAYNLLGYSRRFLGDFGAAETAFQRYTELIPDEPNPHDSYAELLMKVGRFDESIAAYRRALEVDPSFVNAYVGIANDLIFRGDAPAARIELLNLQEVARNDGQRRLAHTWSAASYLHEGDYEKALAEIRRATEIAAATSDFGAMSGDRNFEGEMLLAAGRFEEAERAFREVVELAQRSDATVEVKRGAQRNSLHDLGRVALARGDVEEARRLAQEYREQVTASKVPFEGWQAHELDGLIAAASGDQAGAAAELGQANQQDPRVLFALARALDQGGDAEAARAACRRVVEFNQLNINYGLVRPAALAMCGS